MIKCLYCNQSWDKHKGGWGCPSDSDLSPLPPGEYEILALAIGRLTDEKSKQYGDSAERAEKIMKVLYPNGVPVEAFKNALLIVRMCDKLCRIATQDTAGVDGAGEDAWKDMAGYSLIGALRNMGKGEGK